MRQREFLEDGRFHDLLVWTLLSHDYPASPCAQADIQTFDAVGRRIL